MPIVNGEYRRPQLRNGKINYRFGWFFVTFQVFENKSELGAIVGECCVLNALGEAVKNLIETLPSMSSPYFVWATLYTPPAKERVKNMQNWSMLMQVQKLTSGKL